MKNKRIPNELRRDFIEEYVIIDLAKEYHGYVGDIPYAIVTELPENEFESKFGEEVEVYKPFVILTKDMYAEIVYSHLNDEREHWREVMLHDPFALEESALLLVDEMSCPDRISESLYTLDCFFSRLKELPDNEGSRVYKRYVIGFSASEIAQHEGVSHWSVRKSISRAKPKVRKIFVELGVVA